VALPIFVMRRFHHSGLLVRPDAGIATPKDLEGKKVGVRAYSVTTGVWTRVFSSTSMASTPPRSRGWWMTRSTCVSSSFRAT